MMLIHGAQLCLTVRNQSDCSPPGSPVLGIILARILEWVAVCLSRWMKVDGKSAPSISCLHHLQTPYLLGHAYWGRVVVVLVAQSCLTLCNPMDSSPPGSSVNGILQARMLEWVAISFSRDQTSVFCIAGRFFTI